MQASKEQETGLKKEIFFHISHLFGPNCMLGLTALLSW